MGHQNNTHAWCSIMPIRRILEQHDMQYPILPILNLKNRITRNVLLPCLSGNGIT
jgi:hypothetical protein